MPERPHMDLIRRHANQLAEHFDSVQIFVSRHDPVEEDGTIDACWGSGNWFGRYGQVQNWLIRQDERIRAEERRAEQHEHNEQERDEE